MSYFFLTISENSPEILLLLNPRFAFEPNTHTLPSTSQISRLTDFCTIPGEARSGSNQKTL